MKVKKDPEEARRSTFISHEPPRNQQNITPGVDTGSVSIANNNNTAALCREIRIVQDLIERCLQLYMNKDEVVKTLLEQARIQPDFTSIVWNRLEQENAEFFKTYYTKLILKKQIAMFNELLEKHHNLLNYAAPLEAPLAPIQESIQHMPVNHLNKGYTLQQQHPIPSTVHPQNDSMSTISNYDLLYENPECGNFHSRRWMKMDNDTTHVTPIQPFMKSEIPSPVSVASHDQFPFVSREISKSVGPAAFEFAELSHVQSVRQVLLEHGNASFTNLADVEEYSGPTELHNHSDQKDIASVKDFFVDTIPTSGLQSEEESEGTNPSGN